MEHFVEHDGPVAVALEVTPKKIFLKWLNGIEKEMELMPTEYDVLTSETNIYLVSLNSYEDEIDDYLDDHFESIFKNELETWSLEVDKWPKERNQKMFNEWFDYKVHNLVNMISVE
ncbi:MAG: hypothetical protein KAG37_04805 [Flavobacteriales bacterium]|nr:hypothetical protein [Flavobacteriales bacterium]